ncbi:MAG: hypothetical protein GXO25_02825 [Euryarchaeota archaeon]|nr:hypothetical protein [Euryarchaeota archaeon]
MKKLKILVFALMMLMVMGSMLSAVSFSPEHNAEVMAPHNIASRATSDVEHITTKFVIDQNTTDPLTGEKGKYGFDSSIVVDAGASLIVKNATVYFLADVAHPRVLTVYGSLILYNATLTLSGSQIQPVYFLQVKINGSLDPNAVVSIEKSRVLYNGWFNVTNKDKNITISNSVFDKMPGVAGSYGPSPYFKNSIIKMENVSFNSLFQHPSSGSTKIGNMTDNTTRTVNTTGDVVLNGDFNENIYPEYANYWGSVPVKELDILLNYSTSANYDNSSKLELVYNHAVLMSMGLSLAQNATVLTLSNTTFSSADLTAQRLWDYMQSGRVQVILTAPHYSGTVTLHSCVMNLFIEKNVIEYGIKRFDFNMDNTTIYAKDLHVAADFNLDYGVDHNRISLYNDSKLYVLNLTVENTLNKKDSCIYAADTASQVYIFRYAKIHVLFNNIPISGMFVNATPYTVDPVLKQKIISATTDFVSHIGYGYVNGATISAVSDSEGYAYLPLMSDIVNSSEWPNSRYVGVYNVWVNGTNGSGSSTYINFYTMQIGLDHFPDLQASNNTFIYNVKLPYYRHVDVGVKLKIDTPTPYVTGRSIKVSTDVFNIGTQAANDVTVYIYVNSNLVNETAGLGLSAGEHITLNYVLPENYFSTDGVYNITAEVTQIWDTNTSNNISTEQVRVGTIAINGWTIEKLVRHHLSNVTMDVYSKYTLENTNAKLEVDGIVLKTWNTVYSGSNLVTVGWIVNVSAGYHTLAFYVNSTLIDSESIYVYRDVDVGIGTISVSPSVIYVDQNVTVTVTATNYGTDLPVSTNVSVKIYDPMDNLVFSKLFKFSYVGQKELTVYFAPASHGLYTVSVSVIGDEDYNPSNNVNMTTFEVNPVPYGVSVPVGYTIVNGTTAKIKVELSTYIADNISVSMVIPALGLTLTPVNINNPINVEPNGKVELTFNLEQKQYLKLLAGKNSVTVLYTIQISSTVTKVTYTFPLASSPNPYYFIIKEKADFSVIPGSLLITVGDKTVNGKNVAEGMIVKISFTAYNGGGIPGNMTYIIKDGNKTVYTGNAGTLAVGAYYNASFNYTLKGVSLHTITVELNANRTVAERDYSNNVADTTINVVAPALEMTYRVFSEEHQNKIYEGDHVIVLVMVLNKNATEEQGRNVYLSGVHVTVQFSGLGVYTGVTNTVGVARISFIAHKTGSFTPTISATYYGSKTTETGSSYKIEPKPLVIPWLWIILGVIAIAIVAFFVYGYVSFKKESSEYMVCGNCGHLIPADAEKCPFCGAVFEKDKVQCPDCGSWIDADSKYCPVCGSVFMDPGANEYDKYMSLKERYEQYLEKYKEEARKYIGENFKKEEFFKWWKTHPEFISFQEWVKRQEEEIEGETVKCPVCGALNPSGAKICRVCGSVLPESAESGEKKNEEKKPPVDRSEAEETTEKTIMEQYKEEYEKIKHPGVVSFDEWVKRKQAEREETAGAEKKGSSETGVAEKPSPSPSKLKTVSKDKSVEEKVKEGYIKCPVCGALNKPDSKVCAVCGSPLEGSGKEHSKEDHSKPVVKKKVIKKVVTVKKE